MPLPPYWVASPFSSSYQRPPWGTPIRQDVWGAGVKLHTVSTVASSADTAPDASSACTAPVRRKKHTMVGSSFSAPAQANPSLSKSRRCRAGTLRYTALRSATQRAIPACSGWSHRCQSSALSWFHSRTCANSPPINSSFLPGCAHISPYTTRRPAKRCHSSPGCFCKRLYLPCTTSSCDSGSTKFSLNAYQMENRMSSPWCSRKKWGRAV